MDRRRRNVITNLGMLGVTALGLAAASNAANAQGMAKASEERGAGATARLLAGKTAVITGAARGIGRATAVAFAREGADIVGVDICAVVDPRSGVTPATPEELNETGKLVSAAGRSWLGIKADTRDLPALRAAASRAEQEFGGIDILFANAGIQSFHPLLEMGDADWNITIDTNVTGTANTLRAFAPYIVKRDGGRIILTSSTQGQHGTMNASAYSASKWAIIGLMKSAALELGRHKNNVAPIVVFLASDAACMVSGATYAVTAGDSANITA
jgi:NAD(P)-dependent dehydrogenase (short-subunit alcohol dehydrogenase family)